MIPSFDQGQRITVGDPPARKRPIVDLVVWHWRFSDLVETLRSDLWRAERGRHSLVLAAQWPDTGGGFRVFGGNFGVARACHCPDAACNGGVCSVRTVTRTGDTEI